MTKTTILMPLTVLLVFIGLIATTDDDLGLPLQLLLGFIYTPILLASLKTRPSFLRGLVGLLFLGIANTYIYFAAAPVVLIDSYLNDFFQQFAFYLLPGLFGCFLTYSVMRYLWRVDFPDKAFPVLMMSILTATIIATPISYSLKDEFSGILVLNSLFWCFAFSVCLTVLGRDRISGSGGSTSNYLSGSEA